MADKDKKRISFSTETIILCCALVLMVLVVVEFFCWQATEFFEVENAGVQPSELLIVTLGAIGAACGLILAARRSAKFSEQVDTGQKQADTAQKQLFNEQLGRGAELLTRTEMPMLRTGVRVLADLAERAISEPRQVKLIMSIIHDFVHANASSPSKGKERLDIALGIRTLGYLYNEVDKSDDSDGFRKLLYFSSCHLEGLNFTETELQGANFGRAKLQEAHFRGAKLQGANFIDAKLQKARFMGAQLQGANFIDAKLQKADLKGAKLQGADCSFANFSNAENLKEDQIKGMIFHAENQPILPKGLEQFLDERRGYEFKEYPDDKSNRRRCFAKSDAEWSERVVNEWVREYLASIGDSEDG